MKKNINGYLIVYLVLLTFFSVFFLYQKHDVGNDSTIAEWLINYSGGFTKRGLLGEISIFFATLFSYELRDVIFNFQIFTVVTYFAFIYLVLKNIEFERLLLLSIFTPIFILYPVAEIEVLARKELFIFIFYILYFFVPKNKIKLHNLFKLIVLPISVLIWEPVVFFLSFWLAIDLIRNESKKIDLHFFLNLTTYIPTIILALYIAFNPLTSDAHLKMTEFLKYNFNEHCYGACTLLLGKSTIIDQFKDNISLYSFESLTRYILIIIIGFAPLFLLLSKHAIINKKIFFFKNFNNLFFPFLIILSPSLLLFAMGSDWGRWVNICYTHSVLFYIYLFKNRFLLPAKENIKILELNTVSKKFFIFVFILYCFGWNPKTLITGDIASFPGYRIPYKVYKSLSH